MCLLGFLSLHKISTNDDRSNKDCIIFYWNSTPKRKMVFHKYLRCTLRRCFRVYGLFTNYNKIKFLFYSFSTHLYQKHSIKWPNSIIPIYFCIKCLTEQIKIMHTTDARIYCYVTELTRVRWQTENKYETNKQKHNIHTYKSNFWVLCTI